MNDDPNQFEGHKALEALHRFGLGADDEEAVADFLKAYTDDRNREDPHTDRYFRAAQEVKTARDRAAMAARDKELGVSGFQMSNLADRAFHQAKPLPPDKDEVSIYGDGDGLNFDAMAKTAFGGHPQDPADSINAQVEKMLIDSGVEVYDDEVPEEAHSSPERFLAAVKTVIARKQAQAGRFPDTQLKLDQLWSDVKRKGLL